MKQLSLDSPGKFSWIESPKPKRKDHEALVKVHKVGVCGTDLHAYAGKQAIFSYPRVLGHELAVEILEAPEHSHFENGDLCTVEAYYPCNECSACLSGKTNCCSKLQVLGVHSDGGHCPYMTIPVDKLHKANGLTTDELALVEPLVIGAHAIDRAQVQENDRVMIMGAGTIGLAAALFAKAAKAKLLTVDINQSRLDFASTQMKLGATTLNDENLDQKIKATFAGKGPTVIIDATGHKGSMESCIDHAEHGARIVYVGFFSGDLVIHDPSFHRKELTLMASRAGTAQTFAKVIDKIKSKAIDPTPMISHRLGFDKLPEDFAELAKQHDLIKAVINISQENL